MISIVEKYVVYKELFAYFNCKKIPRTIIVNEKDIFYKSEGVNNYLYNLLYFSYTLNSVIKPNDILNNEAKNTIPIVPPYGRFITYVKKSNEIYNNGIKLFVLRNRNE